MNKIYGVVWSEARQTWVVTAETSSSKGKPSSPRRRLQSAVSAALMATSALAMGAPASDALPTGGNVTAGTASISQSGSTMNINQSTTKAIINWNTFNIGSGATVNFNQPGNTAVTLNRVLGNDPSSIYGRLNAPGQVFLINPNGVLFGAGARVDVGGLVASTMNIRDEDFLAGNYRFNLEGATGSILNQGELIGDYIALLAPEVRNEGVIAAQMGTVALAAGDAVSLNITGDQLIDIQVDQASINTLIENKYLIQAEEGTVILAAQSANQLLGSIVNSGNIEAKGITTDGGKVKLLASSNIEHSGSINVDAGTNGNGGTAILLANLDNPDSRTDVSGSITARGGSESGDGGFIETSASHLKFADSAFVDTSTVNGSTGQWLLDPLDFVVASVGGDITGATLSGFLSSNNVTIQTAAPDPANNCTTDAPGTCGNGSAGTNGDIIINDTISWARPDTDLTLLAWGDIVFDTLADITNEDPFFPGAPLGAKININYGMDSVDGKAVIKQGATWSFTSPTIVDLAHGNATTIASDVDNSTRDVYIGTTGSASVFVQLNAGSGTYGSNNTTWDYYDAAGGNAINLSTGSVSGSVTWNLDPATQNVAGSPYALTYTSGLDSDSSRYSFAAGDAANWTVNKALLTVTADDKSMTQGSAVPSLTATITGFVNGENSTSAGVTGDASLSTVATSGSAAGTEAITVAQGTLDASNYDFAASTYVDGTLTINAASSTPPVTPPSATPTPNTSSQQTNRIILSGAVNEAQSQRKMSWQEAYKQVIDHKYGAMATNYFSQNLASYGAVNALRSDERYLTGQTVKLLIENGWTAKDFKDNGVPITALLIPKTTVASTKTGTFYSSGGQGQKSIQGNAAKAQVATEPAFTEDQLKDAGYSDEELSELNAAEKTITAYGETGGRKVGTCQVNCTPSMTYSFDD